MSKVDYLPDEMNYERSNLCWNEPATADAFNAGWRAACETMQARAQAEPAADWRAACVVEQCTDGEWDVISPTGAYWLDSTGWYPYDSVIYTRSVGVYRNSPIARAALSACPTPPPDAEVPKCG